MKKLLNRLWDRWMEPGVKVPSKRIGFGCALAMAVAVGCADQATPTALDTASGPHMGHKTTTYEEVKVLERVSPLSKDVTVRARIGRDGGTIKIRDAGLYVSFPAGALSQLTDIVLTAKAGKAVIFDFGPSPLQFAAPVKVEIDLRGTTAYKNADLMAQLRGAYFPGTGDDALAQLRADGTVLITEFYAVDADVKTSKVKFHVDHFSGYLLSVP